MRKITVTMMAAALTACMVFTGCKKDDDDKGTATVSGNLDITIEGVTDQIDEVRMFMYNSSEDQSEQIATAKVTNGKFTITLPDPVPSGVLETFNLLSGVTASDPAVKGGDAYFDAYKSGSLVGDIFYGTNTDGENDINVDLFYVDRDCTITGTHTDTEEKYIDQYNLNLKKGWNYWADIEKGKDANGNDVYEYNTSIPAGVKWYFNSWSSSN